MSTTRRPKKSPFHLPRKVAKPGTWKDPSGYTISDSGEHGTYGEQCYRVDGPHGRTWHVQGWNGLPAAQTHDGAPWAPPAYIVAEVERQWSADTLLAILRPARLVERYANGGQRRTSPARSRVLVIQRHVSRSGMLRALDLYTHDMSERLTYHVARVCGMKYNRDREALEIGGCGMDMHFAAVYDLASYLYGDGYALTHRSV